VAALRHPARPLDLLLAEAHRRTRAPHPPAGPARSTTARLLAVDTETYWRVGGHCNAAHDPLGESGLVRAVRRAGGRVATVDGRHAIEFLDGSLWPRERAGTATPGGAGGRHSVSDTENSILHSFTDTARRLLAAFTAAPSPGRAAQSRAGHPTRTGNSAGHNRTRSGERESYRAPASSAPPSPPPAPYALSSAATGRYVGPEKSQAPMAFR
jgi:hypothetical protein